MLALAVPVLSTISLILTGDVNLFPFLTPEQTADLSYVWGDMLPVLQNADLVCVNHEGTIAEVPGSNPDVIQFQDPLNYTGTYKMANVGFMTFANNHQYDFHLSGVAKTLQMMEKFGIPHGGLHRAGEDQRLPRVVRVKGLEVAVFSIVVDECWQWPNGTLYLDGCTCGDNAGKTPPYQCYNANRTFPGLWYNWGITDSFIAESSAYIGSYAKAHQSQLIIAFLHVGPNFQWQPYPQHENLLRNISMAGADIVWGTSSHHVQRFEYFQGKPIVYGLGDLLFRHIPGVDDFCPLYAIPCESYQPDLALTLRFMIQFDANSKARPVVQPSFAAIPTRHTERQTFRRLVTPGDVRWLNYTINEISNPVGAQMAWKADDEAFYVTPVASKTTAL